MIHTGRESVRRDADWLYEKIVDHRISPDQAEIDKMINKYPDAVVFQYLKLKFQESRIGTRKLMKTFKIYADRYPGYVLFQYLYESSLLLYQNNSVSISMSDRLYLKNFYPARSTFCREEVLLYIHYLTLRFGFVKDIAMVEAMLDSMEKNHPGLLPDNMEFTARLVKLTKVAEWCENWISDEFKPSE